MKSKILQILFKISFTILVVLTIILLLGCEKSQTPSDDEEDLIVIEDNAAPEIDVEPDWSPDGKTIAYTHHAYDGPSGSFNQIWLLDLHTMEKQYLTLGRVPNWSPDGKSVVYTKNNNIHVIEVETGEITKLTNQGECYFPSFSPDGNKIIYDMLPCWPTVPVDSAGIRIMNVDGSNKKLILKGRDPNFSPDGKKIIYVGPPGLATGTESQIWIASINGTDKKQITKSLITNLYPTLSPDGSKIAWNSFGKEKDPMSGIWVISSDGTLQRHLVTWGVYPSWSPDGNQIVYSGGDESGDLGFSGQTLWIMNSDGTNKRPLTTP